MAQDYAKKSAGNKTSNRKSTRTGKKKVSQKSELPSWVWFITGFASGFFVAFLVYLLKIGPAVEGRADEIVKQAESSPSGAPVEEHSEDSNKPRFEFYNLLPKVEIDVDTDKPVEDRSVATNKTRFILQCGSFRRMEDAETRRTELLLMDLPANIQTVSLKSGEKTHRVIAGPYDNMNAMHRAQDLLSLNGIDSLTIKMN